MKTPLLIPPHTWQTASWILCRLALPQLNRALITIGFMDPEAPLELQAVEAMEEGPAQEPDSASDPDRAEAVIESTSDKDDRDEAVYLPGSLVGPRSMRDSWWFHCTSWLVLIAVRVTGAHQGQCADQEQPARPARCGIACAGPGWLALAGEPLLIAYKL